MRDRVLYNLVFFALLMIGAAILVGQVSIGIERDVIVSLGLSAISVIGIFIAIFLGVALVSKEMDKRTLYALLAKPVKRWEFLLGKFVGLVMTLTVNTAAMAAGLYIALWSVNRAWQASDIYILTAVYLILLKLALIVALALLFSCFTTPFLAILFTAGMYVAGLLAGDLRTVHGVELDPERAAVDARHFLRAAEFREFQRDGRGGARARRSRCACLASDAVRPPVHRDRADGSRHRIFAAQSEMNRRAITGAVSGRAAAGRLRRACGSCRKKWMRSERSCNLTAMN